MRATLAAYPASAYGRHYTGGAAGIARDSTHAFLARNLLSSASTIPSIGWSGISPARSRYTKQSRNRAGVQAVRVGSAGGMTRFPFAHPVLLLVLEPVHQAFDFRSHHAKVQHQREECLPR